MFIARQADLFHENVAPAVGIRTALQITTLREAFNRKRQGNFKCVEVAASGFERTMKRERRGKPLIAQRGVGRIDHELWTGQQVFRLRIASIVALIIAERKILYVVRDEVFE